MIAKTPQPPYYAVIFTTVKNDDQTGYAEMAEKMGRLSAEQPGFIGMEHAESGGVSITVCYWESEDAIRNWNNNSEHLIAQQKGRDIWYKAFATRICRVERDNRFEA